MPPIRIYCRGHAMDGSFREIEIYAIGPEHAAIKLVREYYWYEAECTDGVRTAYASVFG